MSAPLTVLPTYWWLVRLQSVYFSGKLSETALDLRGNYICLPRASQLPGRVYMLNKRRAALKKKIEVALRGFAASAEGKQYFNSNKLEGYRLLKRDELKSMDHFAEEVRKVLASEK